MLYTLTLSPSLDRTIDVEEFVYDDVNEIIEEKRTAGGKGIDAARMVRELGGQSIVLGLVGGYNGLEVEGRLVNEGLLCDFVRISGETRTNIMIHQRRKKMQTLLSSPMTAVSHMEVAAIFSKIKDLPRESFVAVSGPLAPGIGDNFYAQIITALKEKNVRVLLDSDGEEMKRGVQACPYLIKPNIHEFGRIVDRTIKDVAEIVEFGLPLLGSVEFLVVSMGARGMVGLSRNERYHVLPPKVSVKSSLGAGDSSVGGILSALGEGSDFREALVLGTACGTAATLHAGHALPLRADVYAIKKQITVRSI